MVEAIPAEFAVQSEKNARKAKALRMLIARDLRHGMTQAEIARKYEKPRQVIWRHVQRLRAEGFDA